MRTYLISLATLAAVLGGCSVGNPVNGTPAASAPPNNPVGAAAVNKDRLMRFEREPGSWLNVGNGYNEQRFSQLDQISDANVKQLGLAWYQDIDTERGQESTPIIVDGVMYLTTA